MFSIGYAFLCATFYVARNLSLPNAYYVRNLSLPNDIILEIFMCYLSKDAVAKCYVLKRRRCQMLFIFDFTAFLF